MRKQLANGMAIVLAAGMIGLGTERASARGLLGGSIGSVIKVFGIGFAVKQFGPDINKVINSLLAQKGLAYQGATKVVPIVSVGKGVQIGAAQVQGSAADVDQVRAVGQAEIKVGSLGLQKLFPVDSITPTKGYHEVRGTGVSAIIDFRV